MSNKNIIIIASVVAIFLLIFYAKGFSNNQAIVGIDKNPDYSQAIADAKAKGEPVFLEFYGNT